jgi:hypothetical protein
MLLIASAEDLSRKERSLVEKFSLPAAELEAKSRDVDARAVKGEQQIELLKERRNRLRWGAAIAYYLNGSHHLHSQQGGHCLHDN